MPINAVSSSALRAIGRERPGGGIVLKSFLFEYILTRSEGTVFWCLSRKFGKFQNETLGERRALKGETDSFCITHTYFVSEMRLSCQFFKMVGAEPFKYLNYMVGTMVTQNQATSYPCSTAPRR